MDASSANHDLQGCLVGMLNGGRRSHYQNNQDNALSGGNALAQVLSPNEMDRIIAKEMTDLSLQERERAEEDVHGIIAGQEEDTLSLQSKLLQMQIHLDRIKAGTAYEEAERRDIIYTRNRELQLMFIRADRYQPKEAAERMVRWFDLKKSLFGSFKLCKSISLDDLNDDDMECMRSGYMQLPPYRDVAGRVIAVGMMKLRKMRSKENVSRVSFYTFMAAMESEEAQKRGMVCVYYLLDAVNGTSVTGNLRSTMPVHIASLHLCYNDLQQYAKTCVGVYALNQQTKVRFRPHYGSHIECQYALTTFGIPIEALPVSASGEMYIDNHMQWIESRRQLEAFRNQDSGNSQGCIIKGNSVPPLPFWPSSSTSDNLETSRDLEGLENGIAALQPNDILFGRGKTVVEHGGNLKFRNMVAGYADEFENSSRLKKTQMTEKIVCEILASGGRFLKRDESGLWEEVDHETARKKVAHAFRNRRKVHGTSSKELW